MKAIACQLNFVKLGFVVIGKSTFTLLVIANLGLPDTHCVHPVICAGG
jgi:hypothetical protein